MFRRDVVQLERLRLLVVLVGGTALKLIQLFCEMCRDRLAYVRRNTYLPFIPLAGINLWNGAYRLRERRSPLPTRR